METVVSEARSSGREAGVALRHSGEQVITQKPTRQMVVKSVNRKVRALGKSVTESVSAGFERTLRFFGIPYALV